MAVRFKKKGRRGRHFIAQWRNFRQLSQDALADRIGDITGASISRIESGQSPYSQDFLEACSEALGCTVADLVGRDPNAPEDVPDVLKLISPSDRTRAIEVLKALARTGPGS